MRKYLTLGLALSLVCGIAFAGEEFSEVEYYRQLAEKQLAEKQLTARQPAEEQLAEKPAATATAPVQQPVYYEFEYAGEDCFTCEEAPPANAFVVIPQYFNSRNKSARADMGSRRLGIGKSRANGMAVTTLYNRRVNDWFSFALMYEYGFMAIRGGGVTGAAPNLTAKERSRWNSHVVGFLPEFNLGAFGKFSPSIIQGFDRGQGNIRHFDNGVFQSTERVDGEGTNVTSLMAWYEKDFNFCDNWKITPYAGWRSLYVVLKSDIPAKDGDNLWVHLVSGGMKLSYQNGAFGFNLRGGVSHRTSGDDVPGYGNRAVAPGVVHFSHRANMDKTVATYGAAVNYALNQRAIVSLGYDGYAGKDTTAHMGSLSFIFPF